MVGNGANGFVPADALPLARTAFANALQRIQISLRAVQALRVGLAFDAPRLEAGMIGIAVDRLHLHELALAHDALQSTERTSAVSATVAVKYLFVDRFSASGRFRQCLQARRGNAPERGGAGHGARRLQEAPAREPRMRALGFRHVSSSILDARMPWAIQSQVRFPRTVANCRLPRLFRRATLPWMLSHIRIGRFLLVIVCHTSL